MLLNSRNKIFYDITWRSLDSRPFHGLLSADSFSLTEILFHTTGTGNLNIDCLIPEILERGLIPETSEI